MLSKIVEQVLAQWRNDGIELLPPYDEKKVISTLSLTRRKFSKDVIELYCLTGGMAAGESDRYLWSLWCLENLANENADYHKPYLLFADFLIHSHLYCFEYRSEAVSAVCIEWGNGNRPQRIADSVEDFFQLYLTKPEEIELSML